MRKILAVCLVAMFLVAVGAPAMAQNNGAVEVQQQQQLPNFIPDGAVPMTDAEMAKVQGEVWYINLLSGAIFGTAALKLIYGDALCNSGVCFFLPWFLKPIYAN